MKAWLCIVLLALCACASSAASLRGGYPMQQLQEDSPVQQQQQPALVSFLQAHARAHAANSAQMQQMENPPSAQAQAAAAQAAPAGAQDAAADGVLAAVENARSLVQTHSRTAVQAQAGAQAQAQAGAQAAVAAHTKGPGEDGDGEPFGPCKTCVFVLERIKKGSNMLLPAICSELYHKYPDAYALCHQVLNALSINGNNVRYWLFEGCFKYEIYQSKEWIKPCPSHVMCSVLKDLSAEPFCPALPMENPFADAAAGGE